MRHSFLTDPPPDLAVDAVYGDDLGSDGYVNNLTRVWAWRPDVLAAFTELRATLMGSSSLSDREAAVLVATTAATRGDSYCALAWGARLAGLTDDTTAAAVLRGEPAPLSARESALAAWARNVLADPNATTATDVATLRTAGLNDREIFEATTWIALRLAFATVNDALGAPPDPELRAKVPAAVRAAVTFGR
ncbi:hypothetical protein VSH64_01955 [Amycolatopsis rhabdoformis]|uniref:Carboxymuconolactone decarboxylase-like domain-containing protein n=1 Tax=Amycolatopsis rhabdoformis TaxID=1448059 RepID=A0ABZ1I8X6_9PSEU|nr:hypothetical protein [Amycolatopsis rhabdoformis]WSE30899.1 hypothetical protein VSH64_01955 [Amycolatopsis rhabdoformis]